jgi:zinc protease
MNMILGGLFQSRLNHEIREEKGFSYGVGSAFSYGRGPGSFRASGGIISTKSDSALILFMKHLAGVQGAIPFTDDEIAQGKDALVQSLPETFASVSGVRGAMSGVYLNDLGEKYYQEYAAKVNAVTRDDLVRVAKKYIDPAKMNLVIVGDRATIEEPLRKTGIAPIVRLDVDGKPVITP